MIVTKLISAAIKDAIRTLTVNGRGKYDPRTANECVPYGIDSSPVADMEALYAFTENSDKSVIIGYINKSARASPGETRIYSSSGMAIKVKPDNTIEIGGDTKHMVRFEELETAFNELKGKFNDLVSKFNSHVHPGVTAGAASTLVTVTPGVVSGADISPAKIDEIKTL